MTFRTKIQLDSKKVEQRSIGNLTLSGDTLISDVGSIKYESAKTLTGDTEFTYKKYVLDLVQSNGEIQIKSQSGSTITNDFTNALGFNLDIDTDTFHIVDNRVVPKGIEYFANYSGGFTSNSLVTKAYVDAIASGLSIKDAVKAATTTNIDLSGGTFGGTIDTYTVIDEDRVLIKNQTDKTENGIYVYSGSSSTFYRAPDFDENSEVSEGSFTLVTTGDTNKNTGWVLNTPSPITLGTTELNFALFSKVTGVVGGTGTTISNISGEFGVNVKLASNSGLDFGASLGLRINPTITGRGLEFTTGKLRSRITNSIASGSELLVKINTGGTNVHYIDSADVSTILGNPIATANHGLIKEGTNVRLGGTLTGDTTILANGNNLRIGDNNTSATGTTSIALGNNAKAYGYGAVAIGYLSYANGCGSSAVAIGGGCAIGGYAVALGGYASCSRAFASNSAEVYGNCSAGFNTSLNCGINSFSVGVGYITTGATNSFVGGSQARAAGNTTFSFGIGASNGRQVIAQGTNALNISQNNSSQIIGHGAHANNSAILGGINHNIEIGNHRAVIIGGSTIKLTGTSYIDTVAVPQLALITEPSTGTGTDVVLVRDASTGIIKAIEQTAFGTPIFSDHTNILFDNEGSITGSTDFSFSASTKSFTVGVRDNTYSGGTRSATFGYKNVASGSNSFAQGYYSCAIGQNSVALNRFSVASGASSTAIGATAKATMSCAIAIGLNTKAYSVGSIALGTTAQVFSGATNSIAIGSAKACGSSSISLGSLTISEGANSLALGNGFSGGKDIRAIGNNSIVISNNNTSQFVCHGANAPYSSIFGGINHNIESGNDRASIIGGSGIKLTGTSYIDTTAVSKLAIMSTPSTGTSGDTILVREASSGLIRIINQSDIVTNTTVNNGLTKFGENIVLGGTLTGDTRIDITGVGFVIGTSDACATGENSIAIGQGGKATGCGSVAIGRNTYAIGCYSFSGGRYSYAHGTNSTVFNSSFGFGYASFAANTAIACGENAAAFGNFSSAVGENSFSIGAFTQANGNSSFSGGKGTNSQRVKANGCGSFNFSSTSTIGWTGDEGAHADFSAILGGEFHSISSGNTRAAIIGGDSIKLTGTTYIDTTAVSKLAIMTTPATGSGSDYLLVRDASTGIIKMVPQQGVSAPPASNGLTTCGEHIVLGGTLTGDTKILTDNYGIAFGSGVIDAIGENSIAIGNSTKACGNISFALGSYAKACGNNSIAGGLGVSTRNIIASGYNSINISRNTTGQTSGYGALAENSVIFGGIDNNIASGNTNSVIIGGNNINLTGTSYIDTVAVPQLALITEPTSGTTSNNILVRDGATGLIKEITQSSIAIDTSVLYPKLTGTTTINHTIETTRSVNFTDKFRNVIDLDADITELTISGNTIQLGTTVLLDFVQDTTTGNYTVTLATELFGVGTTYTTSGGVPPDLALDAGSKTRWFITKISTTEFHIQSEEIG